MVLGVAQRDYSWRAPTAPETRPRHSPAANRQVDSSQSPAAKFPFIRGLLLEPHSHLGQNSRGGRSWRNSSHGHL